MKYDNKEITNNKKDIEVKKEKEIVIDKIIQLSSAEAKERITYKDSEGNCIVIVDGKEVECVILNMSSKGDIGVGVVK